MQVKNRSLFVLAASIAFAASIAPPSVADPPPGSRPIRVRVQNPAADGWREGDLVAMTRDHLIVAWSSREPPDTLTIRELSAIEVSNTWKTSGWRTLAGFGLGAAAGAGAGYAVGMAAYANSPEELAGLEVMGVIGIGAVVGGFLGLVIGQSPARVWQPLDAAALDDPSSATSHVPAWLDGELSGNALTALGAGANR